MSTALAEIGDLFSDFHRDEACAPAGPELQSRLHKLTDSPWRSLGQYLDYSGWDDRARFVELDIKIKALNIPQALIDARSQQLRACVIWTENTQVGPEDEQLLRPAAWPGHCFASVTTGPSRDARG